MAPTHWEEALDASAVSRPGTTQYEPGPTWEAWEDELREEHEYDDWESKLQASAKRDPAMRPARVTTVDVMVREALVSGLGQDEAIARAAAAPLRRPRFIPRTRASASSRGIARPSARRIGGTTTTSTRMRTERTGARTRRRRRTRTVPRASRRRTAVRTGWNPGRDRFGRRGARPSTGNRTYFAKERANGSTRVNSTKAS